MTMNCPRQTRSRIPKPRFVPSAIAHQPCGGVKAGRPGTLRRVPPPDRAADRPAAGFDQAGDATRRTWLANERTWLAWVRTGLTSTAVALGVGKLVPELAHAHTRWPYEAL